MPRACVSESMTQTISPQGLRVIRGFQKSLGLRCSGLGDATADDGGHTAAEDASDGGGAGLDALGDVVDDGTQLLAEFTELVGQLLAEGVDVVGETRLDELVRQVVERLLGGLHGVLGVVEVAGDVLLGGVADGDDVQTGLLDGQLAVGHGGFRELQEAGAPVGVHAVEAVEHLDDALLTGQRDHSPMRSVSGINPGLGLRNYKIIYINNQAVRCCYAYFHKLWAYIFIERSN